MDTTGRLLTAAQVAERLGYAEHYVWKLGREGVLPRVELPGRRYVRFAAEDVERLVARARRSARMTTFASSNGACRGASEAR